jgi:hypothetical protein
MIAPWSRRWIEPVDVGRRDVGKRDQRAPECGAGCPRLPTRVRRVTTNVRVVTPGDLGALGDVLGRAYADDPVWTWVYPQPDRSRRLARMFRSLLRATGDRGATVLTGQARRGAAIWQRANDRSLGALGNLRIGTAMITRRCPRSARPGGDARDRAAPSAGTALVPGGARHRSGAPGRGCRLGVGRHVLDDPANAGEPAYLETETEANVPFYERHGFRVVGELDVPSGGPHLWLMWRDPHEPS